MPVWTGISFHNEFFFPVVLLHSLPWIFTAPTSHSTKEEKRRQQRQLVTAGCKAPTALFQAGSLGVSSFNGCWRKQFAAHRTPHPLHSLWSTAFCVQAGTHTHSQLLLAWFTSTVGTRHVCTTPAVYLRPAQAPDCPLRYHHITIRTRGLLATAAQRRFWPHYFHT